MSETRTAAAVPFATAARPRLYRLGDRGQAVAEIRERLARLDLVPASGGGRHADPDSFDEPLDQAVRAFQQQRGLSADGIVGPSTYRVLEEARWRLGDRLLTHVAGNVLA